MKKKEHEKKFKEIYEYNNNLLNEFFNWLEEKNLKSNTIEKHVFNVRFFINEFLLSSEIIEVKEGYNHINEYFSHWFIKKTLWASDKQIKTNSSSIKKFYSFLVDKKVIEKTDLTKINKLFKENIDSWIEIICKYDNIEVKSSDEFWK